MSPKLLNILLVLVPVVLYYGIFDPLYTGNPGLVWTPKSSISGLQAENVSYSDSINQIKAIQAAVTNLNKDYTNVNPDLKTKATIMLPDSVDPVKLRNEVVTIANKSGVAVSNINVMVDQKNADKSVGVYLVTYSVKSKYPQFKKFMENYEKNMRLFMLESVTINKPEKKNNEDEKDSDPEALSMAVTSRVYYLK